jgi:hypothetical protein
MLACVREHLLPEGYFLFETRSPNSRNLLHVCHPEGDKFAQPDGGQLVLTKANRRLQLIERFSVY